MDSLQSLFSSKRQQGASIDAMQKSRSQDYLIVMRREYLFRIFFLTNDRKTLGTQKHNTRDDSTVLTSFQV